MVVSSVVQTQYEYMLTIGIIGLALMSCIQRALSFHGQKKKSFTFTWQDWWFSTFLIVFFSQIEYSQGLVPTNVPTVKPSLSPIIVFDKPEELDELFFFYFYAPTKTPSLSPTRVPGLVPTIAPTVKPSLSPTRVSGLILTSAPTMKPSLSPTTKTGLVPTTAPTVKPSLSPTRLSENAGCVGSGTTGSGPSFGIYIAYFVGIVILFTLIDYSGIFDGYATRLEECFADVTNENPSKGGCCSGAGLRYEDKFYEAVGQRDLYFKIKNREKCYFPDGLNLYFTRLPVGLVENFILYLFNTNDFLSMVLAMRGLKLSRGSRRLSFLFTGSLAFFFTVILTSSTSRDRFTDLILIFFVVNPSTAFFKYLFLYGLSCPCFKAGSRCGNFFRSVGFVVLFPISLLSFAILYSPADTTSRLCKVPLNYIADYAWQTHILATGQSILLSLWQFFPYGSLGVKICGFEFVFIGDWALEKFRKDGETPHSCCCLFYTGTSAGNAPDQEAHETDPKTIEVSPREGMMTRGFDGNKVVPV